MTAPPFSLRARLAAAALGAALAGLLPVPAPAQTVNGSPHVTLSINGEPSPGVVAGTPLLITARFEAPGARPGPPASTTLGDGKAEAWSDLVSLDLGDASGQPVPSSPRLVQRPKEKTLVLEPGWTVRLQWELPSGDAGRLAPGVYRARLRLGAVVLAESRLTIAAPAAQPTAGTARRRWRADIMHGLATGDRKEAEAAVWSWLKTEPRNPDAFLALSAVLERGGEMVASYGAASRALALTLDPASSPIAPDEGDSPAAFAGGGSARSELPAALLDRQHKVEVAVLGLDKISAAPGTSVPAADVPAGRPTDPSKPAAAGQASAGAPSGPPSAPASPPTAAPPPTIGSPGPASGATQPGANAGPVPPGIGQPAVVAPPGAAAPADAALQDYNQTVKKGDDLFAAGDYFEAVLAYERAWRISYNNKLKTDAKALDERLARARQARDAKKK